MKKIENNYLYKNETRIGSAEADTRDCIPMYHPHLTPTPRLISIWMLHIQLLNYTQKQLFWIEFEWLELMAAMASKCEQENIEVWNNGWKVTI